MDAKTFIHDILLKEVLCIMINLSLFLLLGMYTNTWKAV